MNKLPWFKFYPDDWITGTREMNTEEKAAWVDLLCFMWKSDQRGSVSGTWEGIARMLGVPWLNCEGIIRSMERKNYLNLTESNGIITLTSRRMEREENTRESNRSRQREFYKRKPNANLTDKKSEVRSQRVVKDTTIEALPQTTKPLTDVQKIVTAFKMLQGFDKNDKSWDKAHFARCTKPAKALLDFLGSWQNAVDCADDIYDRLTAKSLTVTLETILKHSAEWKKDHQERSAKNGVFSVPGNGSGSFES